MDQLTQLVLAVIGGGGFVKLIEMYFQSRRQKARDAAEAERKKQQDATDEFNKDERIVRLVIDEVTRQRDDANRRVEQLEGTVERVQLELQGLKLLAGRDPFPRWIVDNAGTYLYVNACFEEQFLQSRGKLAKDLIGKRHEDLWPPEFAAKLRTLDELARRRPDGRAKATVAVDGRQLTVYKLPVRHNPTGAIVGYEGWITDIEPDSAM